MFAFPTFLAPAAVYARLLNTLLQREDWARTRLSQHSGKTVRLVVAYVNLNLTIESSGLTQSSDKAIIPDVTLTIPARHISKLPALIKDKDPAKLTAILHIEGDASLAQTVSDLARDLRWDIEHDLASRFGDTAALRMLQGGSLVVDTARHTTQRLTENMGEYLAHESGLMANRQAFTVWTHNLNEMQQRLEQLEIRINGIKLPAATPEKLTSTDDATSTAPIGQRQSGDRGHV